jgi:hypothetical protein
MSERRSFGSHAILPYIRLKRHFDLQRLLRRHHSGFMRDHYSGGGAKARRVEGVICW